MAVKTNGVGTPGDGNAYVKKDTTQVATNTNYLEKIMIKKFKLNEELRKQFNRHHGERLVEYRLPKLPVESNAKDILKSLDQALKEGRITKAQYDVMKPMAEKLKNKR